MISLTVILFSLVLLTLWDDAAAGSSGSSETPTPSCHD